MPTLRRVAPLLLLLAAAVAVAPPAHAAGEVEGSGFAIRAPVGFKPVSGGEQADDARSFTRRTERGEFALEVTSVEHDDLDHARLEMKAGEALDALAGLFELSGGEVERLPAAVRGAEEAYQVVVAGENGSQRMVAARRGTLIVAATLRAPAGAEGDAQAAWDTVLTSLEVRSPGGLLGPVLLGLLGALAAVAAALTLRRRSARAAFAPPPPAPGQEPVLGFRSLEAEPAPAPSVGEHLPLPQTPALTRLRGGGFSRADDGLPVFSAEEKARGLEPDSALKLPAPLRRPAARPASPSRTPAAPPPPPRVTIRR